MRGQCGGIFNPVNCVYNKPAVQPETDSFRKLLVDTCGAEYATGPACCDETQLNQLVNQVQMAKPIVASCPACWSNFLQFWCSFTCSPNQSTFVNITNTGKEDKQLTVQQADYWVGDNFGTQFYDSCKDIKFGSSNGYAMDFIGGGAKDWHGMVSYMGTKRLGLGSPFQIDFPPLKVGDALTRYDDNGKACNDSDPQYRCACVDCEATCPLLEPAPGEVPECRVGLLNCWSFAMVTTYGLIVLIVLILVLTRNHRIGLWLQKGIGYNWQREENRGLYEPVALDEDESDGSEIENLLDPDHIPKQYWLNSRLQGWFYRQGLFCARHPWLVIILGLVMVTLASAGWTNFAVEQDPIHLWVAPSSRALAEKEYFDNHFSPFYRVTQLFVVNEEPGQPIASADRLKNLFKLEREIKHMQSDEHGYTLQDVCVHPTGDACIIQSVTGYWQGDIANFDPSYWKDDLLDCAEQPSLCLPDFQQPLKPSAILGGYEGEDYLSARAFVVTFVITNSLDPTVISKADEWEKSLLRNILSKVNDRPEWKGVRITYSTEGSLETELNKSSNTDALTVIISYLVMFIYASVALGRFRSWNLRRLMIDSKFGLGVCGILIVIFSVSTAVGLFSLTGKKTTLIIAEVIPFLVLAVGVDNIFILCHEYARREDLGEEESVEERVAKTLGKMGPSILLSSLSETVAFSLGTLVTMPAVSSFAIVASIAIFVDFILQVTCFVSCMALDAKRTESNRLDCAPCIRIRAPELVEKEGWLQALCREYYVPAILNRRMRYVICLIFLGLFMLGLALVPELPLGLDQRIALPSDSYLVPYFDDLDKYLNIGPPVYFVVRNANMTDRAIQKKICGRFAACDPVSLGTILEQERKRSKVSYIGEPTSVWVDDFLHWLDPSVTCCYRKEQHSLYFSTLEREYRRGFKTCDPDYDKNCVACLPDYDINMETLPQGEEFLDFYDIWISMIPDENCPLSGKAAYGDAIVVDRKHKTTEASHFRTFHTPLRTQKDFIAAQASARRISESLSKSLGMDVYPYSLFYVFFEQYSYISMMALELLGLAILAIFIITSSLLGSMRSGIIVMIVVIMILIDVMGVMTLWNVSLNAVSLVNLVICVGISVEFCCHIARGFTVAQGSREERAGKAMVDVGSSALLFLHLHVPKFLKFIISACVNLSIVVLGALHGLVLLPVLLSRFGGEGMSMLSAFDDGTGFGWERNNRGLLIDDSGSYDQVFITDMPEESQQGRGRKAKNRRRRSSQSSNASNE
ncbi:patched family-domain-containing protein [Phascolomyces articulosus]|uniref:Patched family-domain-containing protein n=1 Tax=Phascolomyces articulosus TaxID=60185 RepID=A0AAD5K981_9FUNG|nr:patched family-domain-containing protein [Phascolomyces articulosus]